MSGFSQPLNIGDECLLNGNFRPKYLKNAIVKIAEVSPNGLYFDVEIVRLPRPRNNGRFFPGAKAVSIRREWLTKREPV